MFESSAGALFAGPERTSAHWALATSPTARGEAEVRFPNIECFGEGEWSYPVTPTCHEGQ